MGKTKNSGLAHGTRGSPQQSLEQETLSNKVSERSSKYPGVSVSNEDIEYLNRCGVKYNKDPLVFVIRDNPNKPIWLEEGNAFSGLKHILDGGIHDEGHVEDFMKKFGVSRENVPGFIMSVVTKGKLISSIPSHISGVDNHYLYMNEIIKIVISDNGYIVTAHPDDKFKRR